MYKSLGSGVTAAVLAALFGGGIWLSPAASADDDLTQLYSLLPGGYDESSCLPAEEPPPSALATVDCDTSPDGRLSYARFVVYPDQATLNEEFQAFIGESVLEQCPNGVNSPANWGEQQGQTLGSIACGTYEGAPDLTYTVNSGLLLGNMSGEDIASVFDWWNELA